MLFVTHQRPCKHKVRSQVRLKIDWFYRHFKWLYYTIDKNYLSLNSTHPFHRRSTDPTIQFHRTNSTTRTSRFTKMFCGRKSDSTSGMDVRWISLANKWKVSYILIKCIIGDLLYTSIILLSLIIYTHTYFNNDYVHDIMERMIIRFKEITPICRAYKLHRSFRYTLKWFLFDVKLPFKSIWREEYFTLCII